jgi:hypothetical protein
MYQLPDVSGRYKYKVEMKAKELGAQAVGKLAQEGCARQLVV